MSSGNPTSTIANPLNRRDLLWLLATSGAALFGGGSLSWAVQRDDDARSAQARAQALTRTLASSGDQIADLTNSLQAAKAEIARLAAELAGTQQRATQVETELRSSQIGPLFEPLVQFVSYLIDRVPFDVSAPFEQAMTLMRRFLSGVPQTARAVRHLLLRPFERYLGQHESGWLSTLAAPLRERALAPAADFLARWGAADSALSERLLAPATAALEKRDQLRAQIGAYKSEHSLA